MEKETNKEPKNYCVTFTKSSYVAGGLEHYINNFYDVFPNLKFIELSNKKTTKWLLKHKKNNKTPEKENVEYVTFSNSLHPYMYGFYGARKILKKEKGANIICNNITFFKMLNTKICKNNNCIMIDHGGGYWASLIMTNHFWLKVWSKMLLFYKKTFNKKFIKNVNLVTFTNHDIEQIQKHLKFKSFSTVPLFSNLNLDNVNINFDKETFDKKNDFVFMGRYAKQKGIKQLVNVSKKANIEIIAAGMGKEEKRINKCDLITNVGYIKKIDEKVNFLIKGKYFLLTSIFDGMNYSAIEALSVGVPIIGIHSFPTIKSIIGENSERGFLFKNYDEMIEFLKKPLDYEVWKKQSENSYNFSKNTLSSQEFKDNWRKAFKYNE